MEGQSEADQQADLILGAGSAPAASSDTATDSETTAPAESAPDGDDGTGDIMDMLLSRPESSTESTDAVAEPTDADPVDVPVEDQSVESESNEDAEQDAAETLTPHVNESPAPETINQEPRAD